MTVELTYLVWAALLTMAQLLITSAGMLGRMGLTAAVGNREDMPAAFPGWVGRARRAHANMLENVVVFAILIIAAHLAGRTNEVTALAASVFFWARLAFAVTYVAGITWLRSLLWFVAFAAMLAIAAQLI